MSKIQRGREKRAEQRLIKTGSTTAFQRRDIPNFQEIHRDAFVPASSSKFFPFLSCFFKEQKKEEKRECVVCVTLRLLLDLVSFLVAYSGHDFLSTERFLISAHTRSRNLKGSALQFGHHHHDHQPKTKPHHKQLFSWQATKKDKKVSVTIDMGKQKWVRKARNRLYNFVMIRRKKQKKYRGRNLLTCCAIQAV